MEREIATFVSLNEAMARALAAAKERQVDERRRTEERQPTTLRDKT